MNRQQLLSRLAARGWPVIYSLGALSLWDRAKGRWAKAGWWGGFAQDDGVLLDLPGRLPPRWPSLAAWDAAVIRWHSARLARAARRIGGGHDAIALLFHPNHLPYAQALAPRSTVFYAYDAFPLTPKWTPAQDELLHRTMASADLVIASSEPIAGHLPTLRDGKPRVLPNGADAAIFEKGKDAPCPADLAAIPSPRIGYIGNISQKVDLATVAEIAKKKPDWHWVFVGKVVAVNDNALTRQAYADCRSLANVHFLGAKQHMELPAYVNHMDVNTMCYRQQGGWWEAGYPLKLHEYLAAGRPVVSADIAAVREFADVIDIAATMQDWIAALERALTSGGVATPESRRRVAYQNTWDRRVDDLEAWLSELTIAPA